MPLLLTDLRTPVRNAGSRKPISDMPGGKNVNLSNDLEPKTKEHRMKLPKTALIALSIALAAQAHGQSAAQLQSEIVSLRATVSALQSQVNLLATNPALALGPFVTVNPNAQPDGVLGPNITFHGANVHIVNGTGKTMLINGLGNLIVGYNEPAFNDRLPDLATDRRGSHNIVVGFGNRYTINSWGSLVAGDMNVADGPAEFITGLLNYGSPDGRDSAILGGFDSESHAQQSVILGGQRLWTTRSGGVAYGTVTMEPDNYSGSAFPMQ
jgi:hypothetical protein